MERESRELAELLADYRHHEGVRITPQLVEVWARQFEDDTSEAVVSELYTVLQKSYLSRQKCEDYINRMIDHPKMVGTEDPERWWKGTHIWRGQIRGSSQKDMLAFLDRALTKAFGTGFKPASHLASRVLYFDDCLFTGSRAKADTRRIISSSFQSSIDLFCVFFATHTLGCYQLETAISRLSKELGKNTKLTFRCWLQLENKRAQKDRSDVYWPASAPDRAPVKEFIAKPSQFPFEPRTARATFSSRFFSGERERQLIENQLFIAGARIVGSCSNPSELIRPLGFSSYGIGFGSLVATYRNCPNNCPLALWWGGDGQFGRNVWAPLLPRKTN